MERVCIIKAKQGNASQLLCFQNKRLVLALDMKGQPAEPEFIIRNGTVTRHFDAQKHNRGQKAKLSAANPSVRLFCAKCGVVLPGAKSATCPKCGRVRIHKSSDKTVKVKVSRHDGI